ncbi:MAG: cell division protein ZapA [Peptococcaceae bacterium]|nr:cell division protein ZapA [Peptococcaceae bacterium]
MEEVHSYTLEVLGQTYQVRSSDDEAVVSAVFERLLHEVAVVGEEQSFLTQREQLLLAALNITQRLLDLEEENTLLLDLLNAE